MWYGVGRTAHEPERDEPDPPVEAWHVARLHKLGLRVDVAGLELPVVSVVGDQKYTSIEFVVEQ